MQKNQKKLQNGHFLEIHIQILEPIFVSMLAILGPILGNSMLLGSYFAPFMTNSNLEKFSQAPESPSENSAVDCGHFGPKMKQPPPNVEVMAVELGGIVNHI